MHVSLQFDDFFQKQKFRRIWDFLKKLKSLRPKLVGTSRTSRSRLWIKVKWCGSNILREQPAFLIANQTGRDDLRHLLKKRKKKTNHRKEILHCHFKGPSFLYSYPILLGELARIRRSGGARHILRVVVGEATTVESSRWEEDSWKLLVSTGPLYSQLWRPVSGLNPSQVTNMQDSLRLAFILAFISAGKKRQSS